MSVQRAGAERWRVRDGRADDVPELCRLFEQVFGQPMTPAEWQWKYQDPALAGGVNVVLECDGGILGHAGAMVLDGVHDGRPMALAQVGDVMLSPRARGLAGPSGAYTAFMNALIASLQEHFGKGMFFGFPGVRPFKLGERLGLYRGTGEIETWQLDCRSSWNTGLRVLALDWADPVLDDLWQRHASRPGVWAVRNRSYLDWRYRRNPRHAYRLLGLRLGWRLDGWVVVRLDGDVLTLIDRLMDESRLGRAIGAASAWAARQGCKHIRFWPGSGFAELPGAVRTSTGIIGVVMPSSAPAFAQSMPMWQPGDTDVF